MREIVVILHNIRSTHNVGSILRTCDGFGVSRVVYSGYTPYPTQPDDQRLPHIHQKLHLQINKTALGAEMTVPATLSDDIEILLQDLKKNGFCLVGLEQTPTSIPLHAYKPPQKIALLIGEEVHGIEQRLRTMCDETIEITMKGSKESFNVSVATGIALYQISTL